MISPSDIIGDVGKQDKTLEAVFAKPVRANIDWLDIVAMLESKGAVRSVGAGSRVRFKLNGRLATFHSPHPRKEAGKPTVRDVKAFLEAAGVKP